MWNWLKRLWAKDETVEDVYAARGVAQTMAGVQGIALPPHRPARRMATNAVPASTNPRSTPQPDNSSDFLTGFVVAEALSGGCPEAGLIGGAIGGVAGGIIGAELADCKESPAPVEFGGGESGGGGASGSWDAPSSDPSPSCDTSSSDSSSSDSSSSFDSGSSDSGSSGSSDF